MCKKVQLRTATNCAHKFECLVLILTFSIGSRIVVSVGVMFEGWKAKEDYANATGSS